MEWKGALRCHGTSDRRPGGCCAWDPVPARHQCAGRGGLFGQPSRPPPSPGSPAGRRARPHPPASFLQTLRVRNGPARAAGRTFISGGAWPGSPFTAVTERLGRDAGWRVHEIPIGHNIARQDPGALAAVLAPVHGHLSGRGRRCSPSNCRRRSHHGRQCHPPHGGAHGRAAHPVVDGPAPQTSGLTYGSWLKVFQRPTSVDELTYKLCGGRHRGRVRGLVVQSRTWLSRQMVGTEGSVDGGGVCGGSL